MALEVVLLSSGIAVGVVGLGAWLATGRGESSQAGEGRGGTSALLAAGAVAALLLFLLTLPSRPPFEKGGALGIGALIGAASALIVGWSVGRGGAVSALAPAGALSAALVPVALLMLLYRGAPSYALVGVLLGQGLALLFLEVSYRVAGEGSAAGIVGLFASAATAAVTGVGLAIARYEEFSASDRLAVGSKLWWAFPAVVLAAVLLGVLVAGLVARRPWVRALVTLVIGGAALALLAARFPRYWGVLLPPLGGYVTGILILALAAARGWGLPAERSPDGASLTALLGTFLLLLLLVAAYRLQLGLGIALAALGFAGAAVLPTNDQRPTTNDQGSSFVVRRSSLPSTQQPAFVAGLQSLSLAALFRLFYAWQGLESTSIYLTAHYAMIGLIVGCLAPLSLGVMAGATAADAEGASHSWQTALVPAAAVVAVPLAMLLLWGLKASAGLLLGLAVGQAFLVFVLLLENEPVESATGRAALAAPVVPLLLLAVASATLIDPLVPFTQELTRLQRAIALLALLSLVPLWTLWISRRRA